METMFLWIINIITRFNIFITVCRLSRFLYLNTWSQHWSAFLRPNSSFRTHLIVGLKLLWVCESSWYGNDRILATENYFYIDRCEFRVNVKTFEITYIRSCSWSDVTPLAKSSIVHFAGGRPQDGSVIAQAGLSCIRFIYYVEEILLLGQRPYSIGVWESIQFCIINK